MNIQETKTKYLKWDKGFGVFSAQFIDGVLTDFRACKSGSAPTLHSSDLQFLEAIRDSLNDLLKEAETNGK